MGIKYLKPIALLAGVLLAVPAASHSQSVLDKLKQKAKDKVDQQKNQSNASDSTDSNSSNDAASVNSETASNSDAASNSNSSTDSAAPQSAPSAPPQLRAYQNYDFVPGETILFADDFLGTQDGEFPAQWELISGQGVVNKVAGVEGFLLSDGNYAEMKPRLKSAAYLPDEFTLEFDQYGTPSAYPLQIFVFDGEDRGSISVGRDVANYAKDDIDLNGSLPASIAQENFDGHWHHVAIAYRKPNLKVYMDQFRVLNVPDVKANLSRLEFGGIATQEAPLTFSNVRLAAGGGMNVTGAKFTDAKIVTHGINFDVDKATLRPESMGTLNQIKILMSSNPTLKFEIDGYTDNIGGDAHNLTLSQRRAEAVKAQLVTMGISADRLTAKGLGSAKPLAPNDSAEGKAMNRRVEFVRTSS